MSIAVLNQVYDEMRRLAVAGSNVAPGDFRLKKLVAPLEQSGAKSPVFARLAEAVKGVVDSTEKTAPTALLELTTLVNAVLYTQGETGTAGELKPLESAAFEAEISQTGARLIKPLLEALTTTGPGRLETIRSAVQRGDFRDLRLVMPAIAALDDRFSDVAELIAERVIPTYGRAVMPQLRAGYDVKGNSASARRLKLLHRFDPVGTRPLLEEALESGSRDVKVGAIECLGTDPNDLAFLVEQSSARAAEVRRAAYSALAVMGGHEATAVLQKAVAGKDHAIAIQAVSRRTDSDATPVLLKQFDTDISELFALRDKKEVSARCSRLQMLVSAMNCDRHADARARMIEWFGRFHELDAVKGETISGGDVSLAIFTVLRHGNQEMQTALARGHAMLDGELLSAAFDAGTAVLSPAELFESFSPYFAVPPTKKKGTKVDKTSPLERGRILVDSRRPGYWYFRSVGRAVVFDPRWSDVAIARGDVGLLAGIGSPASVTAIAYLKSEADRLLQSAKKIEEFGPLWWAMDRCKYPDIAETYLAVFEKFRKKADYQFMAFTQMLPSTAIPRLEQFVPTLEQGPADHLVAFIERLRNQEQ